MFKLCFGIVLAVFLSMSTMADTDAFTAEEGFIYPGMFTGILDQEVGHVFQNTARMAGARTHQSSISSAQNFLGFDQLRLGGLYADKYVALSFGLIRFYTDDIVGSSLSSETSRGIETGSLASETNRFVVAGAWNAMPDVSLGTSFTVIQQKLAGDSAAAYSGDISLAYRVDDALSFGAYTRHLISSEFSWEDSSDSADLPRRMVLETRYRGADHQIRVSTDFDYYRFEGDLRLAPMFSVFADSVTTMSFGQERYSIGTVLRFGDFALQYRRIQYTVSDLDLGQDMFSLVFFAGYPVDTVRVVQQAIEVNEFF